MPIVTWVEEAPDDPLALFARWLAAAAAAEPEPEAMALATVAADGMPSARMVLLKGYDARGFVFFTNVESRKGTELAAHPVAALLFHWKSLGRQVRVEGTVARASEAEADAYFATRHPQSQAGAWASAQSRPLASRAALLERFEEFRRRFGEGPVPRPPHWAGFRVHPRAIEFWQGGEHRLHDRVVYRAGDAGWQRQRLNP